MKFAWRPSKIEFATAKTPKRWYYARTCPPFLHAFNRGVFSRPHHLPSSSFSPSIPPDRQVCAFPLENCFLLVTCHDVSA